MTSQKAGACEIQYGFTRRSIQFSFLIHVAFNIAVIGKCGSIESDCTSDPCLSWCRLVNCMLMKLHFSNCYTGSAANLKCSVPYQNLCAVNVTSLTYVSNLNLKSA